MTILVTGSRGITSRRLTALLHQQYPVLVAARSTWTDPALPPSVAFNWTDETTFESPFAHRRCRGSPISAIYIVAPTGEELVLAGELAALAFHGLTTSEPNLGIFVLGPDLLSYDDVTEAFSRTLGEAIRHERLSDVALVKRLMDFRVPEPGAQGLVGMDFANSQGAEERTNDGVFNILGRQPKSLL